MQTTIIMTLLGSEYREERRLNRGDQEWKETRQKYREKCQKYQANGREASETCVFGTSDLQVVHCGPGKMIAERCRFQT